MNEHKHILNFDVIPHPCECGYTISQEIAEKLVEAALNGGLSYYELAKIIVNQDERLQLLEAAGAKLADATQDLISALPLEFSNWEIVPVHKALLEWNEINKEREK